MQIFSQEHKKREKRGNNFLLANDDFYKLILVRNYFDESYPSCGNVRILQSALRPTLRERLISKRDEFLKGSDLGHGNHIL